LKTSIKTITYLSDIGCLEIQGASLTGLRYALSYLAKQDQKEHGIILMRSRLPEKSNRGRPRHN
ncbi:hypothetical protein BEA16_25590, partial [Escherichia coli]|uniref:hypothetical protein n=1 Tax=Escherichia coli TaxID=562 RepID=UPI000DF113E6